MYKIEIGGGTKPKGDDWINCDILVDPRVQVHCNFTSPDLHLPFEDDSVEAVYSSHCFEHVDPLQHLLHELVRVCRVGAAVEIRVPHWLGTGAMIPGHCFTITPEVAYHWGCEHDWAAETWWKSCRKKLRLLKTEYGQGGFYEEAAKLFPSLAPRDLMQFIPGAAHESIFYFDVVENPFFAVAEAPPPRPKPEKLTRLQADDILGLDWIHPLSATPPRLGLVDVVNDLLPLQDRTVLELGCCDGYLSCALAQKGAVVTATDVRPLSALLTVARSMWEDVQIRSKLLCAEDLSRLVQPGEYDLLWHCGVLYHLVDPVANLQQAGALFRHLVLETHVAVPEQPTNDRLADEWTMLPGGYFGRWYREHGWQAPCAGVDDTAFWLDLPSLEQAIRAAGYTQLHQIGYSDKIDNGPRVSYICTNESIPAPAVY